MSQPSVLIVHNRYQERGGEDSVFEAEATLLESRGHRVERLLFDNRELAEGGGALGKARLAVETVWSNRARARIREAVRRFGPDVVHFHNTFPQVSPAAYAVCHEAGAAVVQTLHNYRLVCPGALLYRDGQPCEDCIGHRVALPGIRHACYRGSKAQTGVAAAMLAAHKVRGTWQRDVDLYIAPSAFVRDKLVEGGLPGERMIVKPHFVWENSPSSPLSVYGDGGPEIGSDAEDGDYALFVGRLTEAKGIETLLAAYRLRGDLPELHVVGEGELVGAVVLAASMDGRIKYRGGLDREGVRREMLGARCLVVPSVWYEPFGMVIVEAFAAGLPVVGARIGAIPELVDDGRTGRLFRPGDAGDLGAKLASMWGQGALEMRDAARCQFEQRYTAAANYKQLIEAYETAMTRAAETHR